MTIETLQAANTITSRIHHLEGLISFLNDGKYCERPGPTLDSGFYLGVNTFMKPDAAHMKLYACEVNVIIDALKREIARLEDELSKL